MPILSMHSFWKISANKHYWKKKKRKRRRRLKRLRELIRGPGSFCPSSWLNFSVLKIKISCAQAWRLSRQKCRGTWLWFTMTTHQQVDPLSLVIFIHDSHLHPPCCLHQLHLITVCSHLYRIRCVCADFKSDKNVTQAKHCCNEMFYVVSVR